MRRVMFITFLALLAAMVPVEAQGLEVGVEPTQIWIGESVNIHCWYDMLDSSFVVPWAYIEQTSEHVLWNKDDFSQENGTHYVVSFSPPLLGNYEVVCSNGTVNSTKASFKVSELFLVITDHPEVIFLGERLRLNVKVIERSDSERAIISNVDFKVHLGEKEVQVDEDATYSLGEEWVVTTGKLSNINPSSITLKVSAEHRGKTVFDTKTILLRAPIEIRLVDVDRTQVLPGDNVTLTIKASEKDSPIPLGNVRLKFQVEGTPCPVLEKTQEGDVFILTLSMPSLPPGTYNLTMRVAYKDYTWVEQMPIDYGVPILIRMRDSNDKPVSVQFKFLVDGIEKKKFVTKSDGSYSGYIPPGIYDLELTFPNSKLILYDTIINDFDDPVKFDSPSTDVGISGIGVGRIFVFEVALSYSSAYLEMKYDSRKLPDEKRIEVYRCENWNFYKRVCNGEWENVEAQVDTVRDLVRMNTSTLSAFLIGYEKKLYLGFKTDREDYFLRDIIRVTGIVEDDDSSPVPEVEVTVEIPETGISVFTKTDESGVFTVEFQGPSEEGNFTVLVKAEKPPFFGVNRSKQIRVARSSGLSVILPESVRVKRGENSSIWVSIINTGQTDFSSVLISLSGIPDGYYILPREIGELKAGEEKKVAIDFSIPKNARIASHLGKLRLRYDNESLEEQFMLTVVGLERNETHPTEKAFELPSLSFPTAKLVLPTDMNVLVACSITLVLFSLAFFLKRRKFSRDFEREDIKNLLLGIKKEVEKCLPSKGEKKGK